MGDLIFLGSVGRNYFAMSCTVRFILLWNPLFLASISLYFRDHELVEVSGRIAVAELYLLQAARQAC